MSKCAFICLFKHKEYALLLHKIKYVMMVNNYLKIHTLVWNRLSLDDWCLLVFGWVLLFPREVLKKELVRLTCFISE